MAGAGRRQKPGRDCCEELTRAQGGEARRVLRRWVEEEHSRQRDRNAKVPEEGGLRGFAGGSTVGWSEGRGQACQTSEVDLGLWIVVEK